MSEREQPPTPGDYNAPLFGHPRGLWVILAAELWDRVSAQGVQALLVLYMVDVLLLPGHVEQIIGFAQYRAAVEHVTGPLSVNGLAAQTFGIYLGLCYLTPVIGGTLGDQLIGRTLAVMLGGLLMAAAYAALAFQASFLLALLLLIVGAGLLRGNLSPQIKALYADGDRAEASAFQLYYAAVNLGVFVGPIVTGAIVIFAGWSTAFGWAAGGMMIGLILYLLGRHSLPSPTVRSTRMAPATLTAGDRRRLAGLAILWPVQVLFWIGQSQVWNMYNVWVRDHVDLRVGVFRVPIPWLQAFDGLVPMLFLPVILALWRWQADRGKEPDDVRKMTIGCAIFTLGPLWLANAGIASDPDGRTPLPWVLAFHLITNVGWLYFTPTAMRIYAVKAPTSLRGTLLGIGGLAIFAGTLISGRLGAFYETMAPLRFWSMHAAMVACACMMLIVLRRHLRHLLADDAAATLV